MKSYKVYWLFRKDGHVEAGGELQRQAPDMKTAASLARSELRQHYPEQGMEINIHRAFGSFDETLVLANIEKMTPEDRLDLIALLQG